MATKFRELSLELINEGIFLRTANVDLVKLQREMIEYRKKFGKAAEKAKGKLTIEIVIQADKDETAFPVTAQSKLTIPTKPPMVSMAMAGESDDGESTLFVRNSGSSEDHPIQEKFCTDDGRTIDRVTGEVVE